MRRPSRIRVWIVAALAIALRASFLAGQSYGTNDQVLTIGMAETPRRFDDFDADGYLYDTSFDRLAPAIFVRLHLPDGAELRKLCAYANDLQADTATDISVVAVKLVPGGGGDPFVLTIPDSDVQTTPGAGYATYCTGPLSYTLRNEVDVDGDQVPDDVAYYLRVALGYHAGVGGVLVTWRRQVSPAPNAPTFGDVPTGDSAFAQIEALAASGITAGCGGGNYCPDAPLTRRQMAAYLASALGLHWVD